MARIRTIKPEFWTDDLVGSLKRDHRLLFIATWNLADDEGLLRWSAPYLKGAVFPYDDDVGILDVESAMSALVDAGIIFPYLGGRAQQKLACIINFHRHQKINRPSPSKLPPPSLQALAVREMYGRRDGYLCHLCGRQIDETYNRDSGTDFQLSIDHVIPQSKGGLDYPSNVRASHQTCNKGRGDHPVEEYQKLVTEGKTISQWRHPARFTELLSEPPYAPSSPEGYKEEGKDKESTPPSAGDVSPPIDPDAELFRRGREVLGRDAGGMVAKLRKHFAGDIGQTQDAIEAAATKGTGARDYIGRILANGQRAPPESSAKRNIVFASHEALRERYRSDPD